MAMIECDPREPAIEAGENVMRSLMPGLVGFLIEEDYDGTTIVSVKTTADAQAALDAFSRFDQQHWIDHGHNRVVFVPQFVEAE